ncbi:MAG: hypothetical protein KBT68_05170 [bacterium]|nr:hypothetical protein [Candidatus Colisoma equi]
MKRMGWFAVGVLCAACAVCADGQIEWGRAPNGEFWNGCQYGVCGRQAEIQDYLLGRCSLSRAE